jgi:hypothetical protein
MRNLLAVMIGVATAFFVVIGLGFVIHERTDAIPDGLFGLLAAVAIVVIAGSIFTSMTGVSLIPRISFRNRFTPVIDNASQPSAAKIAYDAGGPANATCIHLQPIERAMRQAGSTMELNDYWAAWPEVEVNCRINETELRRVFSLPATVSYRESYQPERSEFDNPRGDIICSECANLVPKPCTLRVKHPDESSAATVWFPSAPDPLSAARIAYDKSRTATATCIHLQPIERAMRAAGVKLELYNYWASWPEVHAKCCIDDAELRRVFALPASVHLKEMYEQDRDSWVPRADILCDECMKLDPKPCTIRVLHTDDARANTMWFPSRPSASPTPPPLAP